MEGWRKEGGTRRVTSKTTSIPTLLIGKLATPIFLISSLRLTAKGRMGVRDVKRAEERDVQDITKYSHPLIGKLANSHIPFGLLLQQREVRGMGK